MTSEDEEAPMTSDDEEAAAERGTGPFFHIRKAIVVPYSAQAPRPPAALSNEPAVERRRLPNLPDDVITGILLRLPARSVVRLRPACKLFNAVTSDPSFIRSHAARAATPAVVVGVVPPSSEPPAHASLYFMQPKDDDGVRVSTSPPITLGYPAAVGDTYLRLDASCDGMLCLGDMFSQKLFVCNPLIRGDWIQLPDYSHRYEVEVCGFYFHASTGEYRLLRKLMISSHYSSTPRRIEVLTLGTNRWRMVSKSCKRMYFYTGGGSLLAHGHLYWMNLYELEESDPWITTFDTETDKFGKIYTPKSDRPLISGLIMLGESLGLCQCRSRAEMVIYVLKDHASEAWTKLHTITLRYYECPLDWCLGFLDMKPMMALKDQGILFQCSRMIRTTCGTIFYDRKLNTVREINLDEGFYLSNQKTVYVQHRPFVESPISCSLFEKKRRELPHRVSKKRGRINLARSN